MAEDIKEIRRSLDSEDIKEILGKYDVEPVAENNSMILYPTVCHNISGGSHKLYYYKKDHIFKCYTECNEVFDIFQLIIKMHDLRDEEISLRKALSIVGVETDTNLRDEEYYSIVKQLDYLHQLNNEEEELEEELKFYSRDVMSKFIFDLESLKPWISEGISPSTLSKYNIKYDTTRNAIVIPYYTPEKELVGVRGRFLDPDAKAKYMPMKFKNEYLSHPTSKVLYGLDVNQDTIEQKQSVILFEGEKSVLKMDTIYGKENIALAVSGKVISNYHVKMLLGLGVKDIVLAFDRDYLSINELKEKLKEYKEAINGMEHFFNITIIVDEDFLLPYKESPIDKGKEVFEKLLEKRIYI